MIGQFIYLKGLPYMCPSVIYDRISSQLWTHSIEFICGVLEAIYTEELKIRQ